jgi:hypothetical protein
MTRRQKEATPPGPRNCMRSGGTTLPCDVCGARPPVMHTPIRAAGRYCAACCPHCSLSAQLTEPARREVQA